MREKGRGSQCQNWHCHENENESINNSSIHTQFSVEHRASSGRERALQVSQLLLALLTQPPQLCLLRTYRLRLRAQPAQFRPVGLSGRLDRNKTKSSNSSKSIRYFLLSCLKNNINIILL